MEGLLPEQTQADIEGYKRLIERVRSIRPDLADILEDVHFIKRSNVIAGPVLGMCFVFSNTANGSDWYDLSLLLDGI